MQKNQIKILKEQINEIENLKSQDAYGSKYKIWKTTTQNLIDKIFDESYVRLFKLSGALKMATSPQHSHQYYIEGLNKKKELLEGFLSEAERFKDSLEVDVSKLTALENYDFHPKIKEVSQKLFENRHYAQAVEEAFKKVIKEVKIKVKSISGKTYDGDSLMNQAFGCDNKEPIIQFNNLTSEEERDEQRGLMFLYKGIVGIRNRKAHDNVLLDDANSAIEYLALASLLVRLLERYAEDRQ
jgi:uncharacterized protein (TIGR02391 family)